MFCVVNPFYPYPSPSLNSRDQVQKLHSLCSPPTKFVEFSIAMPPRKRPAPSEADEPLSSAEEPAVQSDSEDEEAWDEVDVTADNSASALALAAASNKAFDVVISTQAKAKVVAGKKKSVFDRVSKGAEWG